MKKFLIIIFSFILYTLYFIPQIAFAAAPTNGLVGYWNFDEGSGTSAADSSGNGNNGTINGASWVVGKVGSGALNLNGTSDRVSILANLIGTNTITICAWINTRSLSTWQSIVGNNSFIFGPYQNDSRLILTSNSGSESLYSADYPITTNTWFHACAVRLSNGTGTIYINGIQSGNSGSTGEPNAGSNIGIGSLHSNGGGLNFNGLIDEVRIYNRALSASEVLDIYNDGSTSSPPPAGDPSPSPTPINGSCGSTLNTCTSGTFFDVTDTSADYLWTCLGSDDGTNSSCSLPIPPTLPPTPSPSGNYPWSNIVDSSRAIDWSKAGILGGMPNRATQCGQTIQPYTGSANVINTAIANCPEGQYVQLGAGTFTLNSGVNFWVNNFKNNVTLRGAGANNTKLVFTGSGGGSTGSFVNMEGPAIYPGGGERNVCDWTAGYTKGTTVITLSNCGNTTPAIGNLSNLKVGSILMLDQLDEATDAGAIWNCKANSVCVSAGWSGTNRSNGTCNGTMCNRSQTQGVVVTAINGNQISISPGLYMPNWRSEQRPQAYFANSSATGMGVENLTVDTSGVGGGQNIQIVNCNGCWVKGVRSIYANRAHVQMMSSIHSEVRDSYFYQNDSHSAASYGVEMLSAWDSLIENNIFQQTTDSNPSTTGAAQGNVIGYNFAINSVFGSPGWFQASFYQHAQGDAFNLWEGNIGTGYTADNVHGTHHFETLFRNRLEGNQDALCGGSPCSMQTIPVHLYAGSRYFNIIGNVLGKVGYHSNYACSAQNTSWCSAGGSRSIYTLGYTGNDGGPNSNVASYCTSPDCANHSYYDPQVTSYLFRWGNWDTVSGMSRFSINDVPSGIGLYANEVPSSHFLPASFYLYSKPNWFGSVPFPAIGPDVDGGNIAGAGSHAYKIPTQLCYENMGGSADGTGSVLTFDANTCYYGGTPSDTIAPSAPTGVIVN